MKAEHPGQILLNEYMKPRRLSANRLAGALRIPQNRISLIIQGKRSITADTALRLALFFDTDPIEWMTLQAHFDLAQAEQPKIRKPK